MRKTRTIIPFKSSNFVAKEVFPFRNDTQLGSITEPYTPEWTVAE